MVVLPADEEYAVELTGTGEGTLELQFEEYEDGALVSERTHTEIPVTNNLTGTFTLTNVDDLGTNEIDTNGDGTNDTILESDTQTQEQIIQELKTYINSLDIHLFVQKSLLWHVGIVERLIERDKTRLIELKIVSFERIVKVYEQFRLLSDEQRNTIVNYLNELKRALASESH